MIDRLHLDYETASSVDLKSAGACRYARDPSTRPLMLGWAFNDDEVKLWQPHEDGPLPTIVVEGMRDPAVQKHAYNAPFERLITRHCLGIDVPPEQWRCTMVASYYLGFAGGMDAVLAAVGLEQKDPRGKQLVNMFSTPAPKNHKADWYDWTNRPVEWADFGAYCIKDVKVERQLYHWLKQFPGVLDWDWRQWHLDQRINDRGVPMDVDMASAAIELWDREKAALTRELEDATGLAKVTRGPFVSWLQSRTGVVLENTRKDYLASLLHKGELPEEARYYVGLWEQKEAKAVSKYAAVVAATGEDGRARGMFQYKGASRTDRVGGRIIQLQNLKRPLYGESAEGISNVVSAIKTRSPAFLRLLYPESVSAVLGGSIRHVIAAPQGRVFAVCDLTSIESVVLGWIAMCPLVDGTFRQGKDTYKLFAANYFGVAYDEVTKKQRGFSKPPVLGCGFMLGWKGLIAYAEGYGVDMSEEQAKRAVTTFRDMYPEIVAFWDWLYSACKYVIQSGVPVEGYRMRFERDADFLRIWLPSGRALSYFKPEVRRLEAPWSTAEKRAVVDNVTYMGQDDKNQWTRIKAHAGGLTENIVQSIAGDILWNGLTNADAAGLEVVLHVHDEIGVEVDEAAGASALATLEQAMVTQPHWCKDMWLGANGFLTHRYTKD